ncbi:MAG: twin-arginine translocase TatA/TatE family subunit [Planctomycetales bacterium]|nr:twin-arginine translocase TatA/TatE family subunit [Planctomycetales bacterium]
MAPAFCLLAFWSPGPGEMLLLLIVALLLYGGELPDVARSWGKTFSDFRKQLSSLQRDFNNVVYSEPEPDQPRRLEYYPEYHDRVEDQLAKAGDAADDAAGDDAAGDDDWDAADRKVDAAGAVSSDDSQASTETSAEGQTDSSEGPVSKSAGN